MTGVGGIALPKRRFAPRDCRQQNILPEQVIRVSKTNMLSILSRCEKPYAFVMEAPAVTVS